MNRLFLVGPRGSGKSTVARLVAVRLGWSCLDADVLLEQRAGMSIREVFATEGEAGFRDRESAVLREVCALRGYVIATGGGVVLRPENRERIAQAGPSVYLSADVETLWARIAGDATTADRRPALGVGGREEVERIVEARHPIYVGLAQLVVDARRPAQAVAEEIAAWAIECGVTDSLGEPSE